MFSNRAVFRIFCALVFLSKYCVESYKILGFFHTMAKSHSIVGTGLMRGLAEAGHDVTVVSPFPQKTPITNYHDIELINAEKFYEEMENMIDMFEETEMSVFDIVPHMYSEETEPLLANSVLKQFLVDYKDVKFDVIILEIFLNEFLLGLGHYFNAPVIGLAAFGATKWTTDLVGSPNPPSYVPHICFSFTDTMSYIQRFGNLLVTIQEYYYMEFKYLPKQEEFYNELFPGPKPPLNALRKNVSLVLLNNHFTTSYPRPYAPNMIEVGGLFIRPERNPIPENILKFIESNKNGFVYFSMGSGLKSSNIPVQVRQDLLKVFSKLDLNVLWKFEDESLPDKPDNVFITSWFPQDDILAHPNVKLFITHGGLLSTTEAAYNGVPILGIPIFGDQYLNVETAKRAGWGLILPYNDLNEATLSAHLVEILSNPIYSENAKIISKRYRDRPLPPLQTAIYWVEYVCRHQGAPHLHIAGQELNFFQYHNLDVFAVMLIPFVLLIHLLGRILKSVCGRSKPSEYKIKFKLN